MNSLLLRSGRVIDPASAIDGAFDVLVVSGEIAAVAPAGTREWPRDVFGIDASGFWVLPGLIDPHVHLRDPGFPEKETIASGLRAAAAGGFTTVAAMANTNPVNDSPATCAYMRDRAREVAAARLVPVSAVTLGLAGRIPVDFAAMAEAGARLFSDDGMPVDDPAILTRALEAVSNLKLAVSLHEEDRALVKGGAVNEGGVSRRLGVPGVSTTSEAVRVRRDLAIVREASAHAHIAHVSTAESIELIRAAREHGSPVTCEVTPHHFMLDDSAVLRWGPNAKMAPPLRDRRHLDALRSALADGTIDMIATDHAPHDPSSKQAAMLAGCFDPSREASTLGHEQANAFIRAANGVVGLETALGLAMTLVHQKLISPLRLAELMSVNPSRLLRLDHGKLAPGAAADITVVDPNLEWTVDPARFLSKSRNTPFAGMKLRGKAILTLVGGTVVYDGRRGSP